MEQKLRLEKFIRDIPDWPVKGILFRDITPLLGDTEAFCCALDQMAEPFKGRHIDCWAASRGPGDASFLQEQS